MDPEEDPEAIQTAVRRFIEADNEVDDETQIVIDVKEMAHAQRNERSCVKSNGNLSINTSTF